MRMTIVPWVACLFLAAPLHAAEKPVKVFILAGQSNMEGKAPNALLGGQERGHKPIKQDCDCYVELAYAPFLHAPTLGVWNFM